MIELAFYAAALVGCLYLLFVSGWERPETGGEYAGLTEAQSQRDFIETALAQAQTARTFNESP